MGLDKNKLSKWDFEKLIIAKITPFGLYLSVKHDNCTYGQSYKVDVSLKEATNRFIDFYYPLYVEDYNNEIMGDNYTII